METENKQLELHLNFEVYTRKRQLLHCKKTFSGETYESIWEKVRLFADGISAAFQYGTTHATPMVVCYEDGWRHHPDIVLNEDDRCYNLFDACDYYGNRCGQMEILTARAGANR